VSSPLSWRVKDGARAPRAVHRTGALPFTDFVRAQRRSVHGSAVARDSRWRHKRPDGHPEDGRKRAKPCGWVTSG
jgi:hypothetical protein